MTRAPNGLVHWERAFEVARRRWQPAVERLSRKLAEDNVALAADIAQEGIIRLWELDPLRYGRGEEFALRRGVVARMRRVAKRELKRMVA